MGNSTVKTSKPAEQTYRVVIDGVVYIGTYTEIQQAIAADRENRG